MKIYFNKATDTLHDDNGYYYLDGENKIYINYPPIEEVATLHWTDVVPQRDEIGWYIDVILPWEYPIQTDNNLKFTQVYNSVQIGNKLGVQ